MAMPTEMGTVEMARKNKAVQSSEERSGLAHRTGPTSKVIPTKTLELTNHLSCWRSSPWARRKRKIMETGEATSRANMSKNIAVKRSGPISLKAAIPNGFSTDEKFEIGPGMNALNNKRISIVAAASHTTGRHRCDNTLPLGKSRKRKIKGTIRAGPVTMELTQAASSPPGSDPGDLIRAMLAYSSEKLPTPKARPCAQKSQPIGLPGWRDAISAPTVGKSNKSGKKRRTIKRSAGRFNPARSWDSMANPIANTHRDQANHAAPVFLFLAFDGWVYRSVAFTSAEVSRGAC